MKQCIGRKRGKEGIATIWTVIFFLVLVMFLGLVVDTGYLVLTRQKMQTVADASALAGVYTIKTDAVASRTYARNIGGMNYAAGVSIDLELNLSNDPLGDIVIGEYNASTKTFTPTMVKPNAVMTTARRTTAHAVNNPVDLIFGNVMGKTQQDVAATAIAQGYGGLGAGVIALNPTAECSFQLRGTGNTGIFQVNNGVVYVNSENSEAMCHSGQPRLDTSEIYVVGGTDKHYEDKVRLSGEVIYTDDPVTDPLADLPEPFYDPSAALPPGQPAQITSGTGQPFEPGYYPDGLDMQNGSIDLNPGVYILDGQGLNITGGDLYALGCMFFIVDTTPSGQPTSNVDIRGGGVIDISAPNTDLYSYPSSPDIAPYVAGGASIFQARDNFHQSEINGTASTSFGGAIYMPSNKILVSGVSGNFATGLIADMIETSGNGSISINYTGQWGVLPRHVYLVL